jgi:hypothetical protein
MFLCLPFCGGWQGKPRLFPREWRVVCREFRPGLGRETHWQSQWHSALMERMIAWLMER